MKKKVVKSVKKEKHFSFKSEYKMCFSFLKQSKEFIYSTVLLFLIFTCIGFFFNDLMQMLFKTTFHINLNEQINFYLKNLVSKTEGMNYFQLLGFIFFNNIQSSFFSMVLGIFFMIFPFIALLFNGYILGFVASLSVDANGALVLWRILPHGIFELPAVFISIGLGFKLGSYLFLAKTKESFKDWVKNSLIVFLMIIFPLLVIAAIIETALIILVG